MGYSAHPKALQLDAEAAFEVSLWRFWARGSLDVFENGVPACWVVERARRWDVVALDSADDEVLAAVDELREAVPFGCDVQRTRAEKVIEAGGAGSAGGQRVDRGSLVPPRLDPIGDR